MAKIAFNKLKLNKETEISKVTIGDVEIEVKHYIPIKDKLLVIDTIINDAFEYNMINKAKADALMHMYILMLYTNITFSKKERDSLFETYDLLEKNGVIDAIVSTIPEIEYNAFVNYCKEVFGDYDKYKNSIVGIAEQVLGGLPNKLDEINSLMGQFDPSQLKVVSDVIQNLGGNQDAVSTEILGQK